ncbi:MAG: hypothetical protein OEZ02_02850 [Anaerolineae bacterium]|nr:hypothetical protein [Anaerolineae bacterium]
MDAKTLKSVSDKVHRQFPEVSAARPKVELQKTPAVAKGMAPAATYLLTYTGKATNAAGKAIPRLVRVTANADGKILKISTSR